MHSWYELELEAKMRVAEARRMADMQRLVLRGIFRNFAQRAEPAQSREGSGPGQHHNDRSDAPADDGDHRREPLRDDPGLESAKLIRRTDKDRVDRRNASSHFVGGRKLHDTVSNHHADVVEGAGEEERQCREPEGA